jgi:hypothetical protein
MRASDLKSIKYDKIEIGASPYDEDCVQIDSKTNYLPAMKAELNRFKTMLEAMFPVPEGVRAFFVINWNVYEFGRYGEVAVQYDSEDQKALEFALYVEEHTPSRWNQSPSTRFQELIDEARSLKAG